ILRDYLSFAIAIYDEYPGWWDFIAGRFYAEYVEPRNYYYAGGMVTQGASLYIRIRFVSDLYSAWLIKAATGTMPYNAEGMKQVMRTVYSYELPNKNAFTAGDDHLSDGLFPDVGRLALISSYLFDDATIRAQLESHKTSYSSLGGYFTVEANVPEYLICSSNGVKAANDVHQDMDLILYNGGWLGQIIARNNWTGSQVAVLMKIGVRTGGNHDHSDAGSFQIWYKTMLAGDTGDYDSYGTTHWRDYHQATIAHNSILINGEGQTKRGGNEMSHRNYLTDSNTLTGTVLGVQYGYADPDTKKTPTYAYIAGDITPAYANKNSTSSSLASEVQRRMLAVYETGNADVPLYFFVFDNITAKNSSYKKTFLLHIPAAPTINGKTVTVEDNGAKLVLQNVVGSNTTITGVGGNGNNYNVKGSQVWNDPQESDGFWGRVEITTNSGSATDQLVNVMYVCDSNKNPTNVTATAITGSSVAKGAVIGNVAAVFVTSKTRQSTGFSFTASGSGNITYYVSGVAAGKWSITSGGKPVSTVTATEEGGLLVFTASAGTVTLTPGASPDT
ncbi:MAG: heparinase II/III family protein, partial [Thermoguttaceae bacterium]|nr:heparinase II/III family protein [Thermoguttaceae bacterium]